MAQPLPLDEAIRSLDERTPIGSLLRSKEWERVPVALRQRAQFSAGVVSARLLQTIQDRLREELQAQREQIANGGQAKFDRLGFIAEVREVAREEGLTPTNLNELGRITDLTSVRRLGLIYDMQMAMASGYARHKLETSAAALAQYPAWRLGPSTAKEPRPQRWWEQRWRETGLDVDWDGVARHTFVALKISPMWSRLSRFGTPWPPFDWGSTRELEEVARDEAVALGLMKPEEVLNPGATGGEDFNAHLEASLDGVGDDLKSFLKESFGEQVTIEDENISWRQPASRAPAKDASAADGAVETSEQSSPPAGPPALEFSSHHEASQYMDRVYHPDQLKPTAAERAALIEYQQSSFDLNGALFRGLPLTPQQQATADNLDAIIARSSVPEAVVVYRGMSNLHWEKRSPGDVIGQRGYSSTSFSLAAAQDFENGALVKIRVPKGAKAVYMDNLDKRHGHEAELLIARGASMKLISKVKVGTVWQIEVELIP